MKNEVKLQLSIFAVLVITSGVLFGTCIYDGVLTYAHYFYLFSAVFADSVAYFVLEDAYKTHSN